MKTLLIALILAGTATPASAAEDWVPFFDHDDGSVSYFDRSSFVRTGDVVRVMARWDRSSVAGSPFHTGLVQDEVNCTARTVQILGFRALDANGRQIVISSEPGDVEAVESGSVGEALFEEVCSQAEAPTTS